jgi:hypothetical protein
METKFKTTLSQEAARRGVKLIDESLTGLSAGNKALDVAAIAGVADIPATSYHRGVDVGLVNYQAKGGELRSGAYTLRLTAIDEIRERGNHPAIAEMVDANGKVASRQRINLEVFSPEVPAERTFDQAVFSVESRFREDMAGGFTPFWIIVVFWCSNGTHGIIVLA